MFKGSYTALVTPFKEGKVDWDALEKLVEWQIAQGSHGLVVCGTTAETPTLSSTEHKNIVERSVSWVKGRIPVIAGTGSNSTEKTIKLTQEAQAAGVDGALVVTPYYNKPTQEGLFEHFRAIATNVDLPIILYNIPGRSVIDMETETMARLTQFDNIVGVKDATGEIGRVPEIQNRIGTGFAQLSGDDPTTYKYLEAGGNGSISVTANIAPYLCSLLYNLIEAGRHNEAMNLNRKMMQIHEALFFESSPQPVKYALFRMGMCSDEMRLPLVRASKECRSVVDEALVQLNLLMTHYTEKESKTA